MTNSYQLTNKTSNLFKDKVDIKVKKTFKLVICNCLCITQLFFHTSWFVQWTKTLPNSFSSILSYLLQFTEPFSFIGF